LRHFFKNLKIGCTRIAPPSSRSQAPKPDSGAGGMRRCHAGAMAGHSHAFLSARGRPHVGWLFTFCREFVGAGLCSRSGRLVLLLGLASVHSRAGLCTFSGRPLHILGPACSHSRAGLFTFSGRPVHILGPASAHSRAGLFTFSGRTKNARKITEIEFLIKMQNDLVLDRL